MPQKKARPPGSDTRQAAEGQKLCLVEKHNTPPRRHAQDFAHIGDVADDIISRLNDAKQMRLDPVDLAANCSNRFPPSIPLYAMGGRQ